VSTAARHTSDFEVPSAAYGSSSYRTYAYVGCTRPGQGFRFYVKTANATAGTMQIEYWNGAAWAALPGVSDGTSGFMVSGNKQVTFIQPGDWAQTNVGGIANLYWIRGRVSAYTSIVTQPKGNRAFIWIKH